jgi:hypothetical protein
MLTQLHTHAQKTTFTFTSNSLYYIILYAHIHKKNKNYYIIIQTPSRVHSGLHLQVE